MERPDEYELLKAVHDHQPPIRGNDLISCCARDRILDQQQHL